MVYVYLEEKITKIENIKERVNHLIDETAFMFDDDFESLQECKESYIDFATKIRVQMNLLSLAIDDIRTFNKQIILNGSNLPNEQINPLDIEFKKELLTHKY